MVNIVLVPRKKSPYSHNTEYHDKDYEDDAGILIDSDAFDFIRKFSVKGLGSVYIEIENIGSNGIEFRVQKARREFVSLDEIVSGMWNAVSGVVAVAPGNIGTTGLIRTTPEATALRLQIRREDAGLNSTVKGVISLK